MSTPAYTVGLYTLGCKVSQYETQAIGEAFESAGFIIRPYESVCDVYVINTCTVTAESDRKSRQIIRRATARNPAAVVLVCGCYSQADPQAVASMPGVDVVIGTRDKLSLVDAARARLALRQKSAHLPPPEMRVTDLRGAPFEPMRITRAPRTRAYVKIEDGCECRCAYCAIPGARGKVRSKAPQDVIDEVEALSRRGTREVVLTGIETAAYGADLGDFRLADLLCALDARGSCERLRLGSLAPELITPAFIARIAPLKILAPHFHLSMQSGSDSVLRRMRRRYGVAGAMEAFSRLRDAIPQVQFTTDMMVGFPGEGEAQFEETLEFVRRAGFLDMHVFAYSQRRGTPAASFPDQVPEPVKRRRSAALILEKNRVRDTILNGIVRMQTPLSVIFESRENGYMTGHSAQFVEVRVATGDNLHGDVHTVLPLTHQSGVVEGIL